MSMKKVNAASSNFEYKLSGGEDMQVLPLVYKEVISLMVAEYCMLQEGIKNRRPVV